VDLSDGELKSYTVGSGYRALNEYGSLSNIDWSREM